MGNSSLNIRDEADALEWRVYAEATCAGLSALIPLPFVDLAFEAYFRRRMPAAVASSMGSSLPHRVERELGRVPFQFSATQGCLWLPINVTRYVLRKIWRKVIYVLTVADAVEQVGYYWHRARLLEHVLHSHRPGAEMSTEDSTYVAFHQVLRETESSPLRGAARKVVRSVRRAGSLLLKARRQGAQSSLAKQRDLIIEDWTGVQRQLEHIVTEYERLYGGRVQLRYEDTPVGGRVNGE
ncbi:MAG: hypothetical protein GY906_01595 [bacterium]|nr:hypothetical protein [bacterium]